MSHFDRLTSEHPIEDFSSGSDALDTWLRGATTGRAFCEHSGFRPVPEGQGRLVMKASTAAASLDIERP